MIPSILSYAPPAVESLKTRHRQFSDQIDALVHTHKVPQTHYSL